MNLTERAVATRNQLEELEHTFDSGGISPEKLNLKLKIYLLKVKQEENIMKIAVAGRKRQMPRKLTGRLNAESEMIECPDQDGKFLMREMCLEYSGDKKHMKTCQTCRNFKATRKLLVP